jgi:hypothetical protein
VRILFAILASAIFAQADSHPSWWNLTSPDATALVGIHWENLQESAFADPIGAELSSAGSLGFPDVACLRDARQILISSPPLLAIASGAFPAASVRSQAGSKGLKPAAYRGVDLWISRAKTEMSLARLNDQLLLVGSRKTLEDAIDRSLAETERRNSPLLARAARFAQAWDLWVVASQLPDPLASLFVPLDADADWFEGGVSLRSGLEVSAVLRTSSEQAAQAEAENLRQAIPGFPAVARGLQVDVASEAVMLSLDVSQEEFSAGLRSREQPQQPVTAQPLPAQPAPAPPELPVPKPAGPQVIRIFGLDEGTREVVLPPPEKHQ